MNTNVRVIEAIQSIVELGTELAQANRTIEELEKDVSYWRTSTSEVQRKLEETSATINTTKTRNEGLAKEIMETKELLERANTEVDVSRARIKELETALDKALTANWTEAVVPKLPEPKKLSKQLAPEPEVVEDVPIVQDENIKCDYYFYIESTPMPGTAITSIQEIKEVRYTRNKYNRCYFSYHEAPNTARNNKFGDLVEMYPPTAYHISLLDNDEQAKYNLAKAKYTALNSSQQAFALTANETDNG